MANQQIENENCCECGIVPHLVGEIFCEECKNFHDEEEANENFGFKNTRVCECKKNKFGKCCVKIELKGIQEVGDKLNMENQQNKATTSKKISPSKDKEYVKAYNSKRRAKKTQVIPAVLEEEEVSRILSSSEKHALLKAKQAKKASPLNNLMEQIKSIIINNWKRVFSLVMLEHTQLFKLREQNGVSFEGKIYKRVGIRKYTHLHQRKGIASYWSRMLNRDGEPDDEGQYEYCFTYSIEELFRKVFVGLPEEELMLAIDRLNHHSYAPASVKECPDRISVQKWTIIRKFIEDANIIREQFNPVILNVKKLEKRMNYNLAHHSYESIFNLKKCDNNGNCSAKKTYKSSVYKYEGKQQSYTMSGLKVDDLTKLTKEVGYKGVVKYRDMANWWLHTYAPLNEMTF